MAVIVADIGGTNARFAISSPNSLGLQHVCYLRCADFAGVEDAYAHFAASVPEAIRLDQADGAPQVLSLAVAGQVNAEFVEVSNNHWQFEKHQLMADLQLDSLLVVRHGRIVVEAYYAPFRPGLRHAVNSVTKAVVGTLAGIAIEDGRLRLDDPVFDGATDTQRGAVTVAHLLDMTSGIDWTEPLNDRGKPVSLIEMERARDWAAYVRGRPMAQAPGAGTDEPKK